MNCEEAKVLIGGDPGTVSVELHEHLGGCRDCQESRALVLAFETRLRGALECGAPVPDLRPKSRRAPTWRLGVGIAAALLAGLSLWLSRPTETLASEVITHVMGEPGSWSQARLVSDAAVDTILQESGLVLRPAMALAPMVYARSCDFRGHRVAHFVVRTQSGPVTVMVLMRERVRAIEHFESGGYRGVLVPLQGGSIAVVGRSDIALERTASEVVRGLELVSSRGEGTTWVPK